MSPRARWSLGLVAVALAAGAVARAGAQSTSGHVHDPSPAATPGATSAEPVSRRVTEHELHAGGGVPRGWKFSVPGGDATKGRELFAELECHTCHLVKGEKFPVPADGKYGGPELTGMGDMHPVEYIAESILSPNAVIVDEPGYIGPDGKSRMPSYGDSLTLAQWLDLVAYLKGLSESGRQHDSAAAKNVERVATAGDYRIRLVYMEPAGHGGHAGHAGHAAPGASTAPTGHLMAFITDEGTGEPVPYLPVSATAHGAGATRTVTLRPMVGDGGFHYGADVALTPQTTKLTLVIGPTTMRVLSSAKGRFAKRATAVFDWSTAAK